MAVTGRQPPRERTPALPDLDAEQEVDLGRTWERISTRWWLPLLGLVVGALIGYVLSVGSGAKTYTASAVIYPGTTIGPGGGVVSTANTTPPAISTFVRSEEIIRRAAALAGMRPGQLRGHISVTAASGSSALRRTLATGSDLVTIRVKGGTPKVAAAANAFSKLVSDRLSRVVNRKISSYEEQLASQTSNLASARRRINAANAALRAPGLSVLERLFIQGTIDNAEQRSAQLIQQRAETQQLIAFAENVERADTVTRAVPVRTTARTRRNSLIVGGLLGLILGTFAALAWEPLSARFGRRPL